MPASYSLVNVIKITIKLVYKKIVVVEQKITGIKLNNENENKIMISEFSFQRILFIKLSQCPKFSNMVALMFSSLIRKNCIQKIIKN